MTRGGRRKGAGRPPIHPDELLNQVIIIRTNKATKDFLTEAADLEKMDLAAWGRHHMILAARKVHEKK